MVETQTATKVAETEQAQPAIINYSPRVEGSPQEVRDFGADAHSQNAEAMLTAFSYLFTNQKMERVNSNDLIQLVLRETDVDFYALYHSDWSDSPIHRGAHAISKGETDETTETEGVVKDKFARGERALVMKEGKVGPKSKGHYFPNPGKTYRNVQPAELKAALQGIVDRCKRCK